MDSRYQETVQANVRLTNELSVAKRTIRGLEDDKAKLTESVSKLEKQNIKLTEASRKVQELQKTIIVEEEAKRTSHLENVQKIITEAQEKMEAISESSRLATEENATLRERVAALSNALQIFEEKHTAELKLADLKVQVEEAKYNEAAAELAKKSGELSVLQSALEAAQSRDKDFMSKVTEIQSHYTKHAEILKEYEKQLEQSTKRIKELTLINNELEAKVPELQKSLIEALQKNATLTNELLSKTKQNNSLMGLCKGLQAEVTSLRGAKGTENPNPAPPVIENE